MLMDQFSPSQTPPTSQTPPSVPPPAFQQMPPSSRPGMSSISSRNRKLVRYAVSGIVLLFLVQLVMYTLEMQRDTDGPKTEKPAREGMR